VAALATIDAKIMDAQRRLDEESDRLKRSAASRELTASADTLDRVADEVASAIAKVPAALDDLLSRLPPPHLVLKANVETFASAVVEALRGEVAEARTYATRLLAGDGVVVSPREQEVKPQPVPPIERQEIFLLGPSRWRENGEIVTSGTHTTIN